MARPRLSVGIVRPPSLTPLIAVRPGIDHHRALRPPTRRTSSAKDGMMVPRKLPATRATRRTMPSSSGSTTLAPAPWPPPRARAGCASKRFVILQKRGRLAARLADRRGVHALPGRRPHPRGRAPGRAPSERRAALRRGRCSLGGNRASSSASAGGSPGSSRAISGGDSRSGSAKTMSIPSTRGCASRDPPHQFGDEAARPRPLAIAREARFVDIDDHDRRRLAWPGPQPLREIEKAQPGLARRCRNRGDAAPRRPRRFPARRRAPEPAAGSCPTARRRRRSDGQLETVIGREHLDLVAAPADPFEPNRIGEDGLDRPVVQHRLVVK